MCVRKWECGSPDRKRRAVAASGPEGGQTPGPDMAHVGNGATAEEEEEEVGVTLLSYCHIICIFSYSHLRLCYRYHNSIVYLQ